MTLSSVSIAYGLERKGREEYMEDRKPHLSESQNINGGWIARSYPDAFLVLD